MRNFAPNRGRDDRKAMKHFLIASVALMTGAFAAEAAQVTNKDPKPVVIVVVDGGNRMDVAIDPGATETICPTGCFMTAPDGDRIGLTGGEKIEIRGGGAVVK